MIYFMEFDASATEKVKRTARKGRGLLLGLLAFLLAFGVFVLWMYHGVSPVVRVEYGEGVPSGADFSRIENAFCLAGDECSALGTHVVAVITQHRVIPCMLIVQDTVAPSAVPVQVEFPSGYMPSPDEFISELRDADRVAVSFAEAYDLSGTGEHDVVILLEDGSGNRSEITATAVVRATVERVTLEAGSPIPEADIFMSEGFHGTLLDPVTEQMMHRPGEYPLRVECPENGRVFPSTLVIRDTVPPAGKGRLLTLRPGEAVKPEDFLLDASDETELICSFATAPDPESREIQDILIHVTDAGENSIDVPAQVLYSSIIPVTVEAKNGLITGADIGQPEAELESFTADIPGTFSIRVQLKNGRTEIALVTIADTVPPALSLKAGSFYTKHPLAPEDLISWSDVTAVSLEYVREPDWDNADEQNFAVKASDAAGNETAAEYAITLKTDSAAPKLYGVTNCICYVGEPILYLREAYAEDDVDGRVELKVDSKVILSQRGKYTVTYTATDRSGNTASKSCVYTLVASSTSEEKLNTLTDEVLQKIITPDMVTVEKLKAVFDYVQKHVRYVGTSDKNDWRKEAVRGLTKGKGDCFTFYSVSRALLEKLDIPYMTVTRKGGATRHYWLIVNIGTGWYHFDSLVNHVLPYKCFMWTNQQLKKMPAYFWRFAEENYPPIETEPFDYDAVLQMERDGRLP